MKIFAVFFLAFFYPIYSQAPFKGTVWQLQSFNNQLGVSNVTKPEDYTIVFNEQNDEADIKADCNGCGANYIATEDSLTVSPAICTRIYCGAESQDNAYLTALAEVTTWWLNENGLYIAYTWLTMRAQTL